MEKVIYLAGGCFWGVQKYFSLVHGVIKSEVGYANGVSENPHYEELDKSGHVEVVRLTYKNEQVSLSLLLDLLYEVIDPHSFQRQGNDIGSQYRTGIYYEDRSDEEIIRESLQRLQTQHKDKIQVEASALNNYATAEEYHQEYLNKNPNGYCHINIEKLNKSMINRVDPYLYKKVDDKTLKGTISEMAYHVTRENATEPAFQNEYDEERRKGIYVDITTGEPLFLSSDKFDSGCGWPAFSKPIETSVVTEKEDVNIGMQRTEIRSRSGDSHLGHVFDDGPQEFGGMRYCINSAALLFIPLVEMIDKGYGQFIDRVK